MGVELNPSDWSSEQRKGVIEPLKFSKIFGDKSELNSDINKDFGVDPTKAEQNPEIFDTVKNKLKSVFSHMVSVCENDEVTAATMDKNILQKFDKLLNLSQKSNKGDFRIDDNELETLSSAKNFRQVVDKFNEITDYGKTASPEMQALCAFIRGAEAANNRAKSVGISKASSSSNEKQDEVNQFVKNFKKAGKELSEIKEQTGIQMPACTIDPNDFGNFNRDANKKLNPVKAAAKIDNSLKEVADSLDQKMDTIFSVVNKNNGMFKATGQLDKAIQAADSENQKQNNAINTENAESMHEFALKAVKMQTVLQKCKKASHSNTEEFQAMEENLNAFIHIYNKKYPDNKVPEKEDAKLPKDFSDNMQAATENLLNAATHYKKEKEKQIFHSSSQMRKHRLHCANELISLAKDCKLAQKSAESAKEIIGNNADSVARIKADQSFINFKQVRDFNNAHQDLEKSKASDKLKSFMDEISKDIQKVQPQIDKAMKQNKKQQAKAF